jgi:hypothetical protein
MKEIFDTEPGQTVVGIRSVRGAVVNELGGPGCETRGVDFQLRLLVYHDSWMVR